MSAVLGMFNSNPARTLASLANVAARPRFELQFNVIQNSVIQRLNDKIAATSDGRENKVDAVLMRDYKRLNAVSGHIRQVRSDVAHNSFSLEEMQTAMGDLQTAVTDQNETAFNDALSRINALSDGLRVTNSGIAAAAGITLDDGISGLKRGGVVRHGADLARATSFSDFVTDAGGDTAAAWTAAGNQVNGSVLLEVVGGTSRITNVNTVLGVKAEAALKTFKTVSTNLTTVTMQIQTAAAAKQAEKADEIGKLRKEYGTMLQNLSIAFEFQQMMNDRVSKSLFSPPELPKGSAANMFT